MCSHANDDVSSRNNSTHKGKEEEEEAGSKRPHSPDFCCTCCDAFTVVTSNVPRLKTTRARDGDRDYLYLPLSPVLLHISVS